MRQRPIQIKSQNSPAYLLPANKHDKKPRKICYVNEFGLIYSHAVVEFGVGFDFFIQIGQMQ